MNSRAYQLQLQAAKAAAASAPAHAANDDEPETPTPRATLLELEAGVGTATVSPPARQGSGGVALMGVGNAVDIIKCPECPKLFSSEKAMFGHLRKHPERGYKGATRPANATSAAAAVAGGDKKLKKQVSRNEADVLAMNMTAAAAAAVTAGQKEPREEDDDEEAAMILLEMASSSRSTTSETQQQESVQQVHAPDAVSVHQTPQDVMQPMLVDNHVAGHQITPEPEQTVQPEIVLELSAESKTPPPAAKEVTNLEITTEAVVIVVPAAANNNPSPGTKKQAKKRPAPQLDLEQTAASQPAPPDGGADGNPWMMRRIPSPASNKKHECTKCGKLLPTYQALGGHMSSHSKGKSGVRHDDLAAAQAMQNILAHRYHQGAGSVVAAATAGSSGTSWGGQDVVVPPATTTAAPAAQSAAPHVCTECHMVFPSGQALGGHKRKHWFPEKHQAKAAQAEAAAAAPAPALAQAEAAAAAPALAPAPEPVALDFDLNELPEEGEGESNQF